MLKAANDKNRKTFIGWTFPLSVENLVSKFNKISHLYCFVARFWPRTSIKAKNVSYRLKNSQTSDLSTIKT